MNSRTALSSFVLVAALGGLATWWGVSQQELQEGRIHVLGDENTRSAVSLARADESTPNTGASAAATPGVSAALPAAESTGRKAATLPAWLWGQSDLSPSAVLQAWHAHARTQGTLYDTAQELVDYAKQNPLRVASPGSNGLTHDAWLDAIAQDPAGRELAHRLLASGYLNGVLEQSLDQFGAGVDRVSTQQAVADLRAFANCGFAECTGWAALLALSPDHAVAAFGALARATRDCGGPQSLETFFRSAEAYGAAAESIAHDWAARKRLALSFTSTLPAVSCIG